jgi:hypothetical protein
MALETVPRHLAGQRDHHAIPRHLGDDRRRRDRQALGVALDDGAMLAL